MTTETYWIVRNDSDEPFDDGAVIHTFYRGKRSRREAEALAAEHGGHVIEITVTERPVGLRWVKMSGDCAACLMDGDLKVHYIWLLPGGFGWHHKQRQVFSTLDAAKAAAEAAIREGWT